MSQFSVAVRNAWLEAYELICNGQALSAGTGSGGSVTGTAAAPKLQIFSGSLPANCAASRTGTKYVDMALPSDWMAAASSGQKALAGTWTTTGLPAAGGGAVMGYYSVMDNAGTTCHEQGLISLTSGGAWAPSTVYTAGQIRTNGVNTYICTVGGTSAGSGGPTGTGGSITDNTVTWAFSSVTGDMTVDNLSVASGQVVNVTSKTLTAPNA